MGSLSTGWRSQTSRSPGALRTFPLRSGKYVTSSLDSIPPLVHSSCSNLSLAPRPLRVTSVPFLFLSYLCPHLYLFYCYYLRFPTCCLHTDMGFNKDRKKKLAELLAKCRAAAAGMGTSTLRSPLNSVTSAPNTTEPAPVDR